jgi:hypothetical protein
MRLGANPNKDQAITTNTYHRVIVPVYVPEESGYFEHGLEVTRMCVESLVKTSHQQAAITVVNNGSCVAVRDYLQGLYDRGSIDQLVHFKENVGKIDAVVPLARGCGEDLITITDADVLFLNGWMQVVEEVYVNFPEAGMVSPVPHGTTFQNYTANTLFDATFKGLLKFQAICDQQDMLRFARSIGKEDSMYKNRWMLHQQLTVKRGEVSAVVGCGHFVSTLRREVFDYAPVELSRLAYASEADRKYIDIPVEKAGLWRLATVQNNAYHMGNTPEDWMRDLFLELEADKGEVIEVPPSRKNGIPLSWKKAYVRYLMMNKYVRSWRFKRWGFNR